MDLHLHVRAKDPRTRLNTLRLKSLREHDAQRLGDGWLGGIGERWPVSLARVRVKSELGNNEQATVDIEERPVKLSIRFFKNSEIDYLLHYQQCERL